MCYWNSQLQDLVSRTVLVGESNSILVVGPRGCGKSMVIIFCFVHVRLQCLQRLQALDGTSLSAVPSLSCDFSFQWSNFGTLAFPVQPRFTNINSADTRRILAALPPEDWRRLPWVMWLKTVFDDRKLHNLTMPLAIDIRLRIKSAVLEIIGCEWPYALLMEQNGMDG